MWSPPWRHQVVHVLLASYQATAFAMVAIHAALLLRDRTRGLHRKALAIALCGRRAGGGGAAALGRRVRQADRRAQPIKLAAAEAHFTTGPRAPLQLGGFADADRRRVDGAIRIPGGLSFLAFGDIDATVTGPRRVPARRMAAGARAAPGFRRDGGHAARRWRRSRCWPRRWRSAGGAARRALVLAPAGGVGAARLRGAGGGLAGHRVGAPALGRARRDAHGGGGHRFPYKAAGRSGCSRSPICSSRRSWSTCSGARSSRATTVGAPVARARPWPSEDPARRRHGPRAGALLVAGRRRLRRRRLGPAGVGPAPRAPAPGHRARHRPDLGGEPRLADPGRRGALHRLPAGVRRAVDRRCTCR